MESKLNYSTKLKVQLSPANRKINNINRNMQRIIKQTDKNSRSHSMIIFPDTYNKTSISISILKPTISPPTTTKQIESKQSQPETITTTTTTTSINNSSKLQKSESEKPTRTNTRILEKLKFPFFDRNKVNSNKKQQQQQQQQNPSLLADCDQGNMPISCVKTQNLK